MATGVNYWSAYEPTSKVRESVWGGAEPDSSSEEGGGGVTWDRPVMEVRGQLISTAETGPDRKQRALRLAELQERRRGLQTVLSTRLAELRRVCLQEAELTGLLPGDFPLEEGEKPPSVRRRGGSRLSRRSRTELEEKKRKTLFSSVRKYSEPEHITHLQSQRTKRTVHRGCHTEESVRSESSSTSDSTGHDNEESVSQCRPLMVTAGSSPVDVFCPNKPRNNAVHSRSDSQDVLQKLSPPLPPPPPRSLDGSSSSGQTEPELGRVRVSSGTEPELGRIRVSSGTEPELGRVRVSSGTEPELGRVRVSSGTELELGRVRGSSGSSGGRVNSAQRVASGPGAGAGSSRCSNSSEGLERGAHTDEELLWANGVTKGGTARSTDADTRSARTTNGSEPGLRAEPGRGRAPYSELLLDYVWTKQQQMLQRQQSHGSRQPITALFPNQPPVLAPPTYRGPQHERQRIKVTRTKSCGPFLPAQGTENYDSQHAPLQPDPHPHLLPPRPSMPTVSQEPPSDEATRSLHKALALEGLRDWYLRNTLGSSHQNPTNGNAGPKTNGIKGRRRTTHGVIHRSTYQDSNSHNAPLHQSNFPDVNHNGTVQKAVLPHSATFHGLSLHSRSVDVPLYSDAFPLHKQEVPLRQTSCDQPTPGTLV